MCTIDGCDGKNFGKGLCAKHWKRNKRHGDPTKGRKEPKDRVSFLRWALSQETDECLCPDDRVDMKRGYWRARALTGEKFSHAYVCVTFNGPRPEGFQAAHSCGNSSCVNKRHLRWASPKENQADKIIHGTIARGETQGSSKLTKEDIIEIRSLYESSELSNVNIGRIFGISGQYVGLIGRRGTWKHLD